MSTYIKRVEDIYFKLTFVVKLTLQGTSFSSEGIKNRWTETCVWKCLHALEPTSFYKKTRTAFVKKLEIDRSLHPNRLGRNGVAFGMIHECLLYLTGIGLS